jgi:4-amino-4-deoxy-L-arabinose transferase-like glycosyltransferase
MVGAELAAGGRLYVDAVERKPPLLLWVYGAIATAAGPYNWFALHLVAVVWTLATMGGLFVIGRRLFDATAGSLAAGLYGVYLPWATAKNLAFNGEMRMNLPLVWAWVLVLRQPAPASIRALVGSGALVGMAALVKQPAGIVVAALAAYLALSRDGLAHLRSTTDVLRRFCLLALGIAVSLSVTAGLLWQQGILREALYWSIGDHDVPLIFWGKGAIHTLGFVGACLPLVVGSVMSLRDRALWQHDRAARGGLSVWLAVSIVGASASGRFYPHYYIQMLPPMVLLTAPVAAALWRDASSSRRASRWVRVATAWVATTVVAFLISHIASLRTVEGGTEAGAYLRKHALPRDRIVVWGQHVRIYTDAERRSATRYFVTFPLTGYVFGGPVSGLDTSNRIVPGAWQTFLHEFDSRRPAFVVDTQNRAGARYPVARFPELARRLQSCYEAEAETKEGVIYRREGCP